MARAADEVIGIYRRHACPWTRARAAHFIERNWIDRFAQMLPRRGRVLDIGCGSGAPIARYLAGLGYPVTGIDSAPEMIAMFSANLPDHLAMLVDMRSLRLGTRFDGLLAWDSFFHLCPEHQRAMFPVFAEHARPAAPLMFTSGPKHGEAIGTLEGDALYHASLSPFEYIQLLDANGFRVIDHMAEDPSCGGRTVWLAQRR